MNNADKLNILNLLLSGLLSGIVVAILNYLLTRRKTKAEIEKLELEAEKIRMEIRNNAVNLSASVSYQLSNKTEQVIYSSNDRDIGFDFKGNEGQIWGTVDGKDIPMTPKGMGTLKIDNGILSIQRANTDGRYEAHLQTYLYGGSEKQFIPQDDLIEGERRMKISFEAKVVGGEHTLKFLFKGTKSGKWLAYGEKRIVENSWTLHNMYFSVRPNEDCQLRIDDQEVSGAPSSIQIRNFVLTEKIA